jgi:hypothetical protein
MTIQSRRYAWSLVMAFVWTVLIGSVASIPNSDISDIGVLLAPGMLLAAIIFQEGVHSDFALGYLVAAGLNAFFYSWLFLGSWLLIRRIRERRG